MMRQTQIRYNAEETVEGKIMAYFLKYDCFNFIMRAIGSH